MAGHAGRDGHHGGDDGTAGSEGVHAAVDPCRADAERALERGHAAFAHAGDVQSRVGRQPVDVVQRQTGVGDRGFARVDGERQWRHHQAAAEPGRADAGDRRVLLELRGGQRCADEAAEVGGRDLVGRAAGRSACRWWAGTPVARQSSIFCRRSTSTVWPNSSSSGSHSTMLVVSRTRGSSTTATCATTYGGGRSGKPNRWLTVNADSVARAGDVAHTHVAAAAVPAYRLRRVDQRFAVPAFLDAQDAVTACGPEELVLRAEFG